MGAIPTFTTPAAMVPSVGGPPMADAAAFAAPAAAAARAGQETANMADQFAQKYINAKLEVDAADQTADLSKQLTQAQFEASKIPDRMQATAHYDAATQKIFDGYENSGANPLVRAHVSARFKQEQVLRRADTQGQAFALESQTQRGKLIGQLDQYGKEAATAADPRLRNKMIEDGIAAIDGRVAGGWMNPEAGAKAKIDFESGVYRNLIDVEMAKNPRVGIAMYDLYKGKLNQQDGHIVGVQTEDKRVELKAEDVVNKRLPVLGTYGNVTHWGPQIEGAAAKTGVRSSLVAAVMSAESAGVAGAVSPNTKDGGYAGPAQLGVAAATEMGVRNRLDPNEAIPGGAGYLKKQLDRFGGDEVAALAAYNWGPENAAKWKAAGSDFSKLPKETQNYIREVQGKDKQFGTAASGDALANYRTEALKAEQELLADNTMDPRERDRAIAILQRRSRTTEGLVLSERKQVTDLLDSTLMQMQTDPSKYKTGALSTLAQRMRATGDNSEAERMDYLAKNETALLDLAKMPPGTEKSQLVHLMPGVAGKYAASLLADDRTARTEARKEAALRMESLNKAVADGTPAASLLETAQEAVAYHMAAGDRLGAEKAISLWKALDKGGTIASLPPLQAQAALRDMDERLRSPNGFNANEQRIYDVAQKMEAAKKDAWKNNPIKAAPAEVLGGPIAPMPDVGGDPVKLQLAINDRQTQADNVSKYMDPASRAAVPPFMPEEAAQLRDRWSKGSVQQTQAEVAKLAAAMTPAQISLVANQIAGKDGAASPFSDSVAMAMAHYGRNMPGDRELADSIIAGADFLKSGGPEAQKVGNIDAATMVTLQEAFGTSRVGMKGESVRAENHAIVSRYADLMRNAGKTTPDADLMKKAAKEIGGELHNWKNGGQLLLPTGVTSTQFRDAVYSLTAADIPPLPTYSGRSITRDMIYREGSFQTMGDGTYKVRMPDPRTGVMADVVRQDTGTPWILDIRPLVKRGLSNLLGTPVPIITPTPR